MEYTEGQNVRDYIAANLNEINNFTQAPFDWRHRAGGEDIIEELGLADNAEFMNLIDNIPNQLNRESVTEIMRESLYSGFIAMLLWGGHHKYKNTRRFFIGIANRDSAEIIPLLNNVDALVSQNNIAGAYMSLLRNHDNYISGVGVRFFTKLLYFLGTIHNILPMPLIYDQFSWNIHKSLLIADGQIEDFFVQVNGNLNFIDNTGLMGYLDYIQRMNAVEGIYSAGQLESILFGWRSGHVLDMHNPRDVMKRINQDFLQLQGI